MKLSDAAVKLLKEYSAKPLARNIHPEDLNVYNQGLVDGTAILAKEILDQLKPDVVVPDDLKESE